MGDTANLNKSGESGGDKDQGKAEVGSLGRGGGPMNRGGRGGHFRGRGGFRGGPGGFRGGRGGGQEGGPPMPPHMMMGRGGPRGMLSTPVYTILAYIVYERGWSAPSILIQLDYFLPKYSMIHVILSFIHVSEAL